MNPIINQPADRPAHASDTLNNIAIAAPAAPLAVTKPQMYIRVADNGSVTVGKERVTARRGRSHRSTPGQKKSATAVGTRAVIYLRVSTPGQVHTDYDPEGISLPAQRKACLHKAEQLGLEIVGEYMEPGKTGTEMTRREKFQEMLKRIKEKKDVDTVIIYKLSRLARDRIDEAIVMDQFRRRGVQLVSATEPIDETPEGQFMQGILSAMNQFRSQQDGATIAYNLGEKAKKGGTIGRAPIGYLNVKQITDGGYEISIVIIDEQRAPYIRLAFQLCADGATIAAITAILAERGLVTRKTSRYPEKPLTISQVHRLLHDPYYTGVICYQGETYPGRHEAIIDQELFDKVQDQLASRGVNTSRYRIYDHPLKGLLYCGECKNRYNKDRRMTLQKAVNHSGDTYWYYFCSGHVDHTCNSPFINVTRVEDAVADYYQALAFSPEFIDQMHHSLDVFMAETDTNQKQARQQLQAKLEDLAIRENRLVELAIDDQLPAEVIHQKLNAVQTDKAAAERNLNQIADDLNASTANLSATLGFLADPGRLYQRLHQDPASEKLLHTAIFERIYVHQDDQNTITGIQLADDLAQLKQLEQAQTQEQKRTKEQERTKTAAQTNGLTLEQALTRQNASASANNDNHSRLACLSKTHLAETAGFEPARGLSPQPA